ncbi:Uncharacterized protein BP5553_00054 [Venustampulla echinocandica]|uniref:NAD(P)-binding protein n=1 Tax=Venustampulla echinocandica TaxID=2656787 RepID=A0A370TX24_9HELO|nr:Uncharacterized protein BP5553_00054 [Venustampulla echinocandica]RDL40075.1 Uncharacterized protein BP5553_00054 [Venustampulla echinocandica]
MASKIVLVIGAGQNIGRSIATHFSGKEYKVAVVSRNPTKEIFNSANLLIRADLSDLSVMPSIFSEVKAKLGVPNVVVYNGTYQAAYVTLNKPDPFSIPVDEWASSLNVNAISAYAAVQQALAGFKELPTEVPKTFIYTGNCGTHTAIPHLMNLMVGKRVAAHMIECAVKTYEKDGFRFYFADQRHEDASPMYTGLDGQAHAENYLELAEKAEQGPWEHTFVKGKGYVDFEGRTG